MKSLALLWIVLFPLFSVAQNWQNICSPGITLYDDPVNHLSSFRLDSVIASPVNIHDTICYSYPSLRKFTGSQSCYDTVYGSVLGNKVLRKANGTFVFFNHTGDSVFLKTGAALVDSWKMITLPGSVYILATVTGMETDSVCGVPDQVKVITLQAKNVANQNIQHIFNNRQIKLSKNYGLTQIFDLVTFPSDTMPRTLTGKTTPPVGVQEFSLAEAYNFNVGDEFHTDDYVGCILGFAEQLAINVILAKHISVTGDTIIYSTDKCMLAVNSVPPVFTRSHDTVNDTIILHKHLFFSGFENLPGEFSPKPSGYCDNSLQYRSSFNNRLVKRFYVDYAKYSPASACWVYNDTYPYYEYSPGLGQTRYYDIYTINSPPQVITYTVNNRLVYYRKGSETWGTPLASNCDALVWAGENPGKPTAGITVSPNPFISQAVITVTGLQPGVAAHIILYDCLGQEVSRRILTSNPYHLQRENLPDGFYIIRVTGNSGTFNVTSNVLAY